MELGAESFAVHDRLTERFTQVTRETYDPFPYHGPYWQRRHFAGFHGGHSFESERTTYLAELTVEPFTGAAPAGGVQIFAAQAVMERLTPRVERPQDVED